ncbi:MAG: enoyl-CoA hydratase/isomerase family protein, partial [Phycisphaeraceae bacterium]
MTDHADLILTNTLPAHQLTRNAPPEALVLEIILNRPDKRNALTPDMLRDIRAHIDTPPTTNIRAILIRANGRAFSAGFDLQLCHDDPTALEQLLRELGALLHSIRTAPLPVIIGAHTAAIAGASAILAAADLVIADQSAKLGYPVVRIGLSPAISAPALIDATTHNAARARLLNPELTTPNDSPVAPVSDRCGRGRIPVHITVDTPEDVTPRAQTEAAFLAAKPPHALAQTKRWLNTLDSSLKQHLAAAALDASLSTTNTPEQRALLARAL